MYRLLILLLLYIINIVLLFATVTYADETHNYSPCEVQCREVLKKIFCEHAVDEVCTTLCKVFVDDEEKELFEVFMLPDTGLENACAF